MTSLFIKSLSGSSCNMHKGKRYHYLHLDIFHFILLIFHFIFSFCRSVRISSVWLIKVVSLLVARPRPRSPTFICISKSSIAAWSALGSESASISHRSLMIPRRQTIKSAGERPMISKRGKSRASRLLWILRDIRQILETRIISMLIHIPECHRYWHWHINAYNIHVNPYSGVARYFPRTALVKILRLQPQSSGPNPFCRQFETTQYQIKIKNVFY